MKKVISIFAVICIFSFRTSDSKYVFTQQEVNQMKSNLVTLYNYIENSNLPHQEVLKIEGLIKNIISSLGKPQTDSLENKPK